jgi:hypothetical protein
VTDAVNDQLLLVCGKSASGKSASLMNLRNPEGVLYLNCESGKRLPFPAKFQQYTITDPLQVPEAFEAVEGMPDVHTVVIDSVTYLMDMYESVYVLNATNTMKAWSDFSQYFKTLMQKYVAASSKSVIFTAHTLDQLNESEMVMETKVPVKGALKNQGIESYFSVVLAAKKMPLKKLEGFESPLLTITEEEEALGFKYVFQTRLTKDTVNERLRGPIGLFKNQDTYADNDVQLILDRLHEYYGN